MKKLFSISVALLMLLSGLQLTISTHYCGGEFADSKVSVLGHVASCGMEGTTDECPEPGNHLKNNCCQSVVSVYLVDHNFSSSSSVFISFLHDILPAFILPGNISFHSTTPINRIVADASPPGYWLANAVSLPKICVFRI